MKFLIFPLLVGYLFALEASASDCRLVKVQNKYGMTKEAELCFLKKATHFISKNCQDLSCEFTQKLRALKVPHSEKDRPGAVICKALGGGVDTVKISDAPEPVLQCVFNDEGKSSISLSMLESWNGKIFSGPAPSLKFEEQK